MDIKTLVKRAVWLGPTHCPVCGAWARFRDGSYKPQRLVELGVTLAGDWPGEQCPICYSKHRQRALMGYLRDVLHLGSRGETILHIAPEWYIGRHLSRTLGTHYISGDLHPEKYRDRGPARRIDLTAIDLPEQSVDVVICSHVLEHIPDDLVAMREMLRVLRPGGIAAIMVPYAPGLESTDEDHTVTDPAERKRRWGQHDHVRIYGRDLKDRLATTGFVVREISSATMPTAWTTKWRPAREVVFEARRPPPAN